MNQLGPRRGTRRFVAAKNGKDFHLRAITWRAPQHAEAFHAAAEMVIDACQDDEGYPRRDEYFLPVAYLYRHCLELRMKDLIYTGVGLQFFKAEEVEEALGGHNLAKLWNHAKKLLVHRWPTGEKEPLQAVEAVVNEFHRADPNGQVFRYDTDKDGKRHAHATLPDHISLAQLRATMDGAFSFLDATASGLEQSLGDLLQGMD
jgi:hypothetical protein